MNRILNIVSLIYTFILARPLFYKFNRAILYLSLKSIGILNDENDYLSGEKNVMKSILKELDNDSSLLLDIGSNEGDFSKYVHQNTKLLSIVAFEPHHESYKRSIKRFENDLRINIVNKAVGAKSEKSFLYDYPDQNGSGHATMIKDVIENFHHNSSIAIEIDVLKLDEYQFDKNVNFVKIDAEGNEKNVLIGMQKMLKIHDIRYLLIEFNEMNTKSNTFLSDLFKLTSGYDVFRILPGGKLIKLNSKYLPWSHEIFAYQNLLFKKV